MKCTFCLSDMMNYSFNNSEIYYCKDCRVNTINVDEKIIRRVFFISKGDKEYQVWLDWIINQTKVYDSHYDSSPIITIPHVMHITPANIKEKLNTLLTFL